MKTDQENGRPLFAFASLWRHHRVEMQDPDSDRDAHAVITTMANALSEPVHPARMPVIWSLQSYDTWLYGTEQDAFRLLKRFPCGEMRIAKQGVGLWSGALYEH